MALIETIEDLDVGEKVEHIVEPLFKEPEKPLTIEQLTEILLQKYLDKKGLFGEEREEEKERAYMDWYAIALSKYNNGFKPKIRTYEIKARLSG